MNRLKSALYSVILYSRVSNRRDSLLINYSVFCQPPQPYSALPIYWFWRILPASPFIPDSSFMNSCAQSTMLAWSLGKATELFIYMLFLPHHTKLFSDYNEAQRSVKRRNEQKNKWFFMWINYLCISMKFLMAVFLPASLFIPTSLFINFGGFCQTPRLLHPPHSLFSAQFASLPIYSAFPFYFKLLILYIFCYENSLFLPNFENFKMGFYF